MQSGNLKNFKINRMSDFKHPASPTFFAPMLYVQNVAAAIDFYSKALGAKELRRWNDEDGGVHVAEMAINNALFHRHEEVPRSNELSPGTLHGSCLVIGLFIANTDSVFANAVAAGATATSPLQNFDYGYRQGSITDPFGHCWQIKKKID